ncbi:hypothetical protein J4763_07195 [Burkholderia pseudomallei]|uniref:hypothetical protein n=1 Tax=Burkholderia pseudomallei TaxID=28450 RepID=UPI001AAF94AC|nr:hypothetical protein [Burkholderia pseudomallei]MBO3056575.1 hypothetical protein [Burkholderia pseudomallei]
MADEFLEDCQRVLEAHFKALADARAAEGLPVYAIEHGLNAETLSKVASGLKRRLVIDERLSTHWLLWVVYATELGYDYDGEEYWPSFEQRTPRWRLQADRRGMLRQWFLRFRKSFRGAVPTGPWATQFSIISWPITHAILPKDLQVQLAKLIYDERYLIAEFIEALPEEVGELVAASAYEASARLRNFLEQPELAGRIVLGLLGVGGQSASHWLQAETTQRILVDLERHSRAKAWLQDAKSTIQSAKTRLASRTRLPSGPRATTVSVATNEEKVALKSVTPQFLLLREANDRWTPVIEIPSFRAIAGMNPRFATILRSSRAKVQGTTAGWSAPGWLLYGPHRKKLAKWPSHSESIVKLEHADTALEYLLYSECRIEPAQCWLFRVRSDGIATEALSRAVHSDTEYILLYRASDGTEAPFPSVHVDCDGISALAVKVTSQTSADALQFLSKVDVRVERHLRIWPVGTPPRRWSADGSAVWLRGETPVVALSHDADCQSLTMSLAPQPPVTVGPVPAKRPIFFGLKDLPIGSHTVNVTARFSAQHPDGGQQVLTSNASLNILMRAPQEWVPGDISHRGFIVICDQVEPTLDALLAGHLSISIAGPRGRDVNCSLELIDSSGTVLSRDPIGAVSLPVTRADFDAHLRRHLEGIEDPVHYSTASQSRLVFDGGDLGVFRLELKHSVLPLRWCVKKAKTLELRLVNDGDNEHPTEIFFYPFERAISPTNIELGQIDSGLHPEGNGGLYVASCAELHACVVASVWRKAGLEGLAVHPSFDTDPTEPGALERLLKNIGDWCESRAFGPLANQRRDIVVSDLRNHLFECLCGRRWASIERQVQDRGLTAELRNSLEEAVHKKVSFGIALSKGWSEIMTNSILETSKRFHKCAERFQICADPEITATALRLATQPAHVVRSLGPDLSDRLRPVRAMPEMVRASRLLVILSGEAGRENIEQWIP